MAPCSHAGQTSWQPSPQRPSGQASPPQPISLPKSFVGPAWHSTQRRVTAQEWEPLLPSKPAQGRKRDRSGGALAPQLQGNTSEREPPAQDSKMRGPSEDLGDPHTASRQPRGQTAGPRRAGSSAGPSVTHLSWGELSGHHRPQGPRGWLLTDNPNTAVPRCGPGLGPGSPNRPRARGHLECAAQEVRETWAHHATHLPHSRPQSSLVGTGTAQ